MLRLDNRTFHSLGGSVLWFACEPDPSPRDTVLPAQVFNLERAKVQLPLALARLNRSADTVSPSCSWSLLIGSCCQFVRLGHPATTSRLVQINHVGEHRTAGAGVIQFGVEQAALGVQHLDVAGIAVVVAQPCVMGISVSSGLGSLGGCPDIFMIVLPGAAASSKCSIDCWRRGTKLWHMNEPHLS